MGKYTDIISDGGMDPRNEYEKAMDAYYKDLKRNKSDMWTRTEPMKYDTPSDLKEGDVYYVRLPGWKTLSCVMVDDLSEKTVLLAYVKWNEELGRFEYLDFRWDARVRYKTDEVEFVEKVKK